jgi:hypothetical protein
MSGGSLNYAYSRVEEAAREVAMQAESPLHRAFAAHLTKVASALHALEWVWSGDSGPGDEVAAIQTCLSEGACLDAAIERAVEAMNELRAELDRAKAGKN